MRLCSGAGCGRAVADDVRFCDECQAERQQPTDDGLRVHTLTDRERYAFLYRSMRWRKLRAYVLRSHPWCRRCKRALTQIIDHRIPAGVAVQQAQDSALFPGDRWAGFFIRKNLQGLCYGCHSEKTDEDKARTGEWPSVMELTH